MPYSTLEVTPRGDTAEIGFLTKRGALGPAFWRELPAALNEVTDARAVVLRGAGDTFSVGLDLNETAPLLAGALGETPHFLRLLAGMQGAVEALATFSSPVIACVSGWCVGAGLELIAAADIRICSREARFSLPEVRLGIVPDLGGLARLPHLIGEGWTRRLALTGEALDAGQAERLGLVSEVLDTPQNTLERARELADAVAELPPATVRGIKRDLNARLEGDVARHYERAGALNAAGMKPELLMSALKK